MSESAERPITLLIAALGGEGGGVLSQWITAAATATGYPVQSTSIPGVSQRTGATTYYLELLPHELDPGHAAPVFALTPNPGGVDVVIASELVEAVRALQNGFVSTGRTTLIASTHRVYAIGERSTGGDGRYDPERFYVAAREMTRRAVLFDMAAARGEAGSVISAVMLGALAGADALPIARATFEQVIRDAGIAVEPNLAGFAAGHALAEAAGELVPPAASDKRGAPTGPALTTLVRRAEQSFPEALWPVLREALARLIDYQDAAYTDEYLARLETIRTADRAPWTLTRETARLLAVWMSYEDVIRVADLKTRRARFERVAAEVGAKAGEPVRIAEFLKPGIEELCSILPPRLARPLLAWAERRNLLDRLNIGLHVRTSTISGFLLMRLLARLRRLRRFSHRMFEERALIERWLAAVADSARHDLDLALEVAACARLVKGYGQTHRRGRANFLRLLDVARAAGLGARDPGALAAALRRAREAALADPEGPSFAEALAEHETAPEAHARRAAGE